MAAGTGPGRTARRQRQGITVEATDDGERRKNRMGIGRGAGGLACRTARAGWDGEMRRGQDAGWEQQGREEEQETAGARSDDVTGMRGGSGGRRSREPGQRATRGDGRRRKAVRRAGGTELGRSETAEMEASRSARARRGEGSGGAAETRGTRGPRRHSETRDEGVT